MPKGKQAAARRSGSKSKVRSKSKNIGKRKSAPAKGGIKGQRKKMRFRPGTVALREIKRYQKSTKCQLPRAAFTRLVRAIARDIDGDSDSELMQ